MVATRPDWGKVMLSKSADIGWNRKLSKTASDLLHGLTGDIGWNREIRMRVSDMAQKLGVSRNAASGALNELIKEGIIRRGELPASYFFTDEWLKPAREESE